VEIDIFNNKYPVGVQFENTRKFVSEILARNTGFNIWQYMRSLEYKQEQIVIQEGNIVG